MIRGRSFLFATATALATVACSDSSTGPSEPADREVAVGETTTIHLEQTDSARRLTFPAVAGSIYSVVVVPSIGGLYLTVEDSSTGAQVSTTVLINTSTSTVQRTLPDFIAGSSGPYTVRLIAAGSGGPTTAEVTVKEVATAPEHVGANINLDGIVAGESIDDPIDLDRFTFSATAGQLIEPFIHAPGAVDVSRIACVSVYDPSGNWLTSAVGFPGDTALWYEQGSRLMLPVTGAYQIEVSSGRNRCRGFPPYSFTGQFYLILRSIDPAPEHASATVSVSAGDTVTGEAIDHLGDIDLFTLQGAPGSMAEIYPRATGSGATARVRFRVAGHPEILTTPDDTSATQHPSGRLVLPDSGKLTLQFTGWRDGAGGDSGAYEFIVDPIDPGPEHHTAAVSIGDSIVDEGIEKLGDLDRFTFAGTAGQLVGVAFNGLAGPQSSTFILRMLALQGTDVARWAYLSNAPDSAFTGRATLSVSGQYTIQIAGEADDYFRDVGTYHFQLYPISRQPESRPDILALGDSVMTEALDQPGDIDDYRITVPAATGARFDVAFDSTARGGQIGAYLTDSATGDTIASLAVYPGQSSHTFSLNLAPGHYRLGVRGAEDEFSLARGKYAIRTYGFSFGAETAADTVLIGDTVAVESIDVPGDVDQFTLAGIKGQSIDLALEGRGAPGGSYEVLLIPPPGGVPPIVVVGSPSDPDSLGAHASARVDLPVTGVYTLRVDGSAGPYTLAVTASPTGPEHRGPTIAIGDTVTGEAIDYLGDLDRFVLNGPPGQDVVMFFSADPGVGDPMITVVDPATSTELKAISGPGIERPTGRFQIPPGGMAEITVRQLRNLSVVGCLDSTCNGAYTYTGGYSLRSIAIDRAPEVAGALIAIGDTVKGESLEPVGDVDEFHFIGTAGSTVSLSLQTQMPIFIAAGALVQLIGTDGATVLGSVSASGISSATSGGVLLPNSGTYTIRVTGQNDFEAHGSYQFVVRTGP